MTPRRPSRTPTIRDVGREAGVSTATASRVVRGEAHVRPEKVEAVMRAVEKLGYVTNSAARSLVERRVGAIALVFPEREGRVFSDPFFGAVVSGVSSVLEDHDLQMLLVMTGSDDSGERMRRFVHGNHCDGLVLASQHEKGALDSALDDLTVPAVSIGLPTQGRDMPHVDLANEAGGRLAAQHLLSAGRRRAALISGPQDMPAAGQRADGFAAEFTAGGGTVLAVENGDYSFASGAAAFRRITEAAAIPGDIDALFAVNDLMALAALQEARGAGLEVPGQLAVMGFDDIDVARAESAGLTTVRNPVAEMALEATRMLIALVEGTDIDERVILQPRLVVRRTV